MPCKMQIILTPLTSLRRFINLEMLISFGWWHCLANIITFPFRVAQNVFVEVYKSVTSNKFWFCHMGYDLDWKIFNKFVEVILDFFNTDVDRSLKFVHPLLLCKHWNWEHEFLLCFMHKVILGSHNMGRDQSQTRHLTLILIEFINTIHRVLC